MFLSTPSDWLDVFGCWSFWSSSFGELDSLSLLELFVLNSSKTRMVEEQILVRSNVDKSESLVRQSLDRAFSHLSNSSKSVSAALPETDLGFSTASEHCIGRISYVKEQRVAETISLIFEQKSQRLSFI